MTRHGPWVRRGREESDNTGTLDGEDGGGKDCRGAVLAEFQVRPRAWAAEAMMSDGPVELEDLGGPPLGVRTPPRVRRTWRGEEARHQGLKAVWASG